MQPKLIRVFTGSTVALLAALAAAVFLCNWASETLIQPHDPVLLISTRILFWILGAVGSVLALICIFAKNPQLKLILILWFALNLIIYGIGLSWVGAHGAYGYLGGLADTFGLSTSTAETILKALFVYLLVGSSALLAWSWLQKPIVKTEAAFIKTNCIQCGGQIAFSPQNLGQKMSCPQCQSLITLGSPQPVASKPVAIGRSHEVLVRTLKISCTSCGGHIEFPTNFFGERIPCPHCQATITLQKARNLKMSCLTCDGRIEFPAHAVGQKIPCPHCKMDITLKEPA